MFPIRRSSTILLTGVLTWGAISPVAAQKEKVAFVPADLAPAFQASLDASVEFNQAKMELLTHTHQLIDEIHQYMPQATSEERQLIIDAITPPEAGKSSLDDDPSGMIISSVGMVYPLRINTVVPDRTIYPLHQGDAKSDMFINIEGMTIVQQEVQRLREILDLRAFSFEPFEGGETEEEGEIEEETPPQYGWELGEIIDTDSEWSSPYDVGSTAGVTTSRAECPPGYMVVGADVTRDQNATFVGRVVGVSLACGPIAVGTPTTRIVMGSTELTESELVSATVWVSSGSASSAPVHAPKDFLGAGVAAGVRVPPNDNKLKNFSIGYQQER